MHIVLGTGEEPIASLPTIAPCVFNLSICFLKLSQQEIHVAESLCLYAVRLNVEQMTEIEMVMFRCAPQNNIMFSSFCFVWAVEIYFAY